MARTTKWYRAMLNPLLSPQRVLALEAQMRELARELIAGFVKDGGCEFIGQYARPLPVTIFLRMMGFPVERMEVTGPE